MVSQSSSTTTLPKPISSVNITTPRHAIASAMVGSQILSIGYEVSKLTLTWSSFGGSQHNFSVLYLQVVRPSSLPKSAMYALMNPTTSHTLSRIKSW
ncbi:hypothetical protein ERO13_D06G144201v2 [Gossypium hirsutum]|uniref:Uncharacterized protein n=3 Tax=Gossypium TaxID=3633 RepID=A0A5J5R3P8_GOSBA|nr:hypothetical protein ES319_D06G169600v1 [Gossypium barbadense]KAG4142671.1 hypothetical protein ERO13_D06G144201v2 [Gossypium hirsutum]TYG65364.1 hypothetical protein ES288_D06G180700v1 [Gossypium darwinii]TYI77842.1 hypothetical protein E1A91_D06G170500v1 [Gossypium mustelinum]